MNLSLDFAVLVSYKGETMLSADKTSTLQALRTKPIVVFAMLLLATLQLSSATHQFDHTASELGDVCSFCLQLDRLDDTTAAGEIVAAVPQTAFVHNELAQSSFFVNRPIFSQPRAPPLS